LRLVASKPLQKRHFKAVHGDQISVFLTSALANYAMQVTAFSRLQDRCVPRFPFCAIDAMALPDLSASHLTTFKPMDRHELTIN
jgi:hypothetical protein